MAVYTHLTADDLAGLIGEYDVGELVSAKGIAEGVSNSNWLVETTGGRFILTMYEHRVDADDLPFFLGLLDHLSAKGSPVPRTIHDRSGAAFRVIDDKAVALIREVPDPTIIRIVDGWAQNFDTKRAEALGFRAERDFDEIIRAHVEDELGGRIGG